MYSNLILLTVITVISASTDGDLNKSRDQRPVVTIVNVTRAYINTNGRRSIETYEKRAYVVNNQGRKKEANYRDNIQPNIVFPDQLEMKHRVTAENNKLLNKFHGVSNHTSSQKVNEVAKATITANEFNNTRHSSNDFKIEQNITMGKQNQSPIKTGHETPPIVINKYINNTNKNINNTMINDNRFNYTNIVNVDQRNKTIDMKNKDNEPTSKSEGNIEGDVYIWSSAETTTVQTSLGDRAAFTGNDCPQGQAKINDTCAEVD